MSTAIAKNFQIGADGTATNNFTIFQPASPDGTLRIGNGNTGITTGLVTLTSAGNLGLGVTPSAWAIKALQVETASIANSSTGLYQSANAFFNAGAWKYIGNGYATQYYTNAAGGEHVWRTATSGTAGNAISFTQAMTLEASGNLLIGGTDTTIRSGIFGIGIGSAAQSSAGTSLKTDGRNWLTFTSSSPTYGNGYIFYDATAAAERARINSSGDFMVGTTGLGTAGRGQFVQPGSGSAGAAISADATSGTFAYSVAWFAANRGASSAFNFINCTSDQYNSPQFRVQGNGVILAQNTTVQSISDARTKENIRDSEDGLQVILALQPRRFDFKQGFGNGRKNVLGFVAQEIETVFPDAVSEVHLDPDSKDVAYKTVGPGELIPVLVKAIQEQQAIINQINAKVEAQAAEIAALKGQA